MMKSVYDLYRNVHCSILAERTMCSFCGSVESARFSMVGEVLAIRRKVLNAVAGVVRSMVSDIAVR